MKKYINGQYVVMTEEELTAITEEGLGAAAGAPDAVARLIEGLSTATSLSEIRQMAKAILQQTEEVS